MIRFSSIQGNDQRLDGGAMFGNAPKALWQKWITPDALNRIPLATRALLVETDHHAILFEAGIGAYMPPHLRERFEITQSSHMLLDNLQTLGLTHKDITDIVLSHLHFDHAGGLLSPWEEEKSPALLFPNARFHVGREAWDRANQPHQRDQASFIPDLNQKLSESNRLMCVDDGEVRQWDDLEIRFTTSQGHTPGMLCSDLRFASGRVLVAADLIPGTPWVHLPITMGYDRFPEKLIEEKKTFLSDAADTDAWVFFTHDPEVALAKITFDPDRKRFLPKTPQNQFTRLPLG